LGISERQPTKRMYRSPNRKRNKRAQPKPERLATPLRRPTLKQPADNMGKTGTDGCGIGARKERFGRNRKT